MKVKFFTLGCKVNQYETQALQERFVAYGCTISKQKADLYVINSCSVTARADVKSREMIRRAKQENPQAKIAVCGCLAAGNDNSLKKLRVDYIINQQDKHNAAEIILNQAKDDRGIWKLKITDFFNHRAFIKIQDGCNNYCSFCKIPYLRGNSISRPRQEVIKEIKTISLKHKEVVLCGINLGLYGRDLNPKINLADIIKKILTIKTLGRIRLSSLEPNLISDKLIQLFKEKKICPHIHLPFQTGDNRVLAGMNKKETVELYEEITAKLTAICPDIAISCDIMIGFPGETSQTFDNTLRFLRKIKPMRMHIFSFSPRENTPLAENQTQSKIVLSQRQMILKNLNEEFSREYYKKFIGKTLRIIGEEYDGDFTCGYTENYIYTYVENKLPLGTIVPVIIYRISNGKVYAQEIKNTD